MTQELKVALVTSASLNEIEHKAEKKEKIKFI